MRTIATGKNAQVGKDLQTCCIKVVKCSRCLFPVVMTSLKRVVISPRYKVEVVKVLLQVVPTRLIQTVRNKLILVDSCCQLLRAADIRLVGTTFCEFHQPNLFQTCQLGTSSANRNFLFKNS